MKSDRSGQAVNFEPNLHTSTGDKNHLLLSSSPQNTSSDHTKLDGRQSAMRPFVLSPDMILPMGSEEGERLLPCSYHNVVALERGRPLYTINGLGAVPVHGGLCWFIRTNTQGRPLGGSMNIFPFCVG
jgi:hypothetical protein